MAEILGSLLISLGLESGEFHSGMKQVEKDIKKATKSWEQTGKQMSDWGKGLTAGLTLPLGAFAVASVKAAQESKDAMGAVEASLKSMGRAAEFTTGQLSDLAAGEMRNSLFDDDEILRKVTTNLLTFGAVAGEQFKRAQAAAVDYSAKTGKDLQASTIMIGKALQDPIKGMAALNKAGVNFSDGQKAMVKSMIATGDAVGAQKVILAEFEKQVRGSAEAQRKADPAAALKQSWAELQETIGAKLLPLFERFAGMLTGFLDKFNKLSPGMQDFAVAGGVVTAALGPVLMVVGSITKAVAPMAAALQVSAAQMVASGAAATTFRGTLLAVRASMASLAMSMLPMAALVGGVYLAYQNWDKIAPILEPLVSQMRALGEGLGLVSSRVKTAAADVTTQFEKLSQSAVSAGVITSSEAGKISAALQQMAVSGKIDPAVLMSYQTLLTEMAKAGKLAPEEAQKIIKSLAELQDAAVKAEQNKSWEKLGQQIVAALEGADAAWASFDKAMNESALSARQSVLNLQDNIGNFSKYVQNTCLAIGHYVNNMVSEISTAVTGRLARIWDQAKAKVEEARKAFFNLWDQVTRNSYIPDMVTEIGQHINRLDKTMVAKIQKQTAEAAKAFQELQDKAQVIMDRLFPEAAKARQFAEDMQTLKDAGKGPHAIDALKQQYRDDGGTIYQKEGEIVAPEQSLQPVAMAGTVLEALDKIGAATKGMADETATHTIRIAESFKDMVDKTLSSVRGLVDGIKKGDVLSVIEGIAGLFMNLGSMGAFGKGVQGRINSPAFDGFRAAGGPVTSGKAYIVGERGPELFSPSASGRIIPNHGLGGSSRFEIVPSPYFNVIVDGRAQGVVGQAAPGIASATSSGLQTRMATNQARRLA